MGTHLLKTVIRIHIPSVSPSPPPFFFSMQPRPKKIRRVDTSPAEDPSLFSLSAFTQDTGISNLFPSILSGLPHYLNTPTPVAKFNSLLVNRIETVLRNASIESPLDQPDDEYDFTLGHDEEPLFSDAAFMSPFQDTVQLNKDKVETEGFGVQTEEETSTTSSDNEPGNNNGSDNYTVTNNTNDTVASIFPLLTDTEVNHIHGSNVNTNHNSPGVRPSPDKIEPGRALLMGPVGPDGMYTISDERGFSLRVLAPQYIPDDIKSHVNNAIPAYSPYFTKYVTRVKPDIHKGSHLGTLGYQLIVTCNRCNHIFKIHSAVGTNVKNHLLQHGISVQGRRAKKTAANDSDNGHGDPHNSNNDNSNSNNNNAFKYFRWGFPKYSPPPNPRNENLWDTLLLCLQAPQRTLDANLNSLDFRAFVMSQSRSLIEFTKDVVGKFDSMVSLTVHEIESTVLVTGRFLPVDANTTERIIGDLDSSSQLRLIPLDGLILGVKQFPPTEPNLGIVDASGSITEWIVELIGEFDFLDRVKCIVAESALSSSLRERLGSETILFIEPINTIIDGVISDMLHSLHEVFPILMDELTELYTAVNDQGSFYYDEWIEHSEKPLISPNYSGSAFSRLYFYYTALKFKKGLHIGGDALDGGLNFESQGADADRMFVMLIILMDICEVALCRTSISVVQKFNRIHQIMEFFSLLNQSLELSNDDASTEKTISDLLFSGLSDKQTTMLKLMIESAYVKLYNYMERLKGNSVTYICEALCPNVKLTTLKYMCSAATFLRESANTYIYFDKLLHVVSSSERLAAAEGTTRNPVFDYIRDLINTTTTDNVGFYRRMQRGKFNDFERYMLLPLTDDDLSTYEKYWILNFQKFPKLSKFALTLFATNCNMVAVEKIFLESLSILRGPVNMAEEGELIQGLMRIKYFLGFYQLKSHIYRKTTFPSAGFLGSVWYIDAVNQLISERIRK